MVMLSGIWTDSPWGNNVDPDQTTPRGQSDKGLQCKQFIPEFRKTTVIIAKILLAHLSQRLIGELIGNSWSGVNPSLTISNIFSKTGSKPNFMWSLLG